jgi:hypothetical protein
LEEKKAIELEEKKAVELEEKKAVELEEKKLEAVELEEPSKKKTCQWLRRMIQKFCRGRRV